MSDRNTQTKTTLALLKSRGQTGVSGAELIYQYGITRAAARIADLRAMGYRITTERRPGATAVYVLAERKDVAA